MYLYIRFDSQLEKSKIFYTKIHISLNLLLNIIFLHNLNFIKFNFVK